jgi:signal transduction histidine kinase
MWRVVAAFRIVTLVYAAVLIVRNHGKYAHPNGGFLVLAAMTAWTAVTVVAYARHSSRWPWLVACDVAVAVAAIMSTRWVESAARIGQGAQTLPVSWAAAPVLACAVAGGLSAGLCGAVAISAADLAERQAVTQTTLNGIVLVLIAGGVGGYVMRLGRHAEAATDRAARLEAATAERERIARGIHDSVLQLLALVSMRGRELGGEAAELGRLAREQELALRSLVSSTPDPPPAGQVDLRALLQPLASDRVTVSCPAQSVLLPDGGARAIAAAAGQALDNVARHAGEDARAWVLVEDEGAAVLVSVRDDGAGFAPGRLAQAARAGRLGVAQAIVGRLRDAGGDASVTSEPGQGTEVELRLPRC